MKNSFLLYTDFYEPIKNLSNEQLGRLFRAIYEYHIDDKICSHEDIFVAFSFFKNQFIEDKNKSAEISVKRKSAGCKGGLASAIKQKQIEAKGSKQKQTDMFANERAEIFENFRKRYRGTKRAFKTEFKNFCKHKDWDIAINELSPALDRYIDWREKCRLTGSFVPEWAHLRTWIDQRRWEMELESPKSPQSPPVKEVIPKNNSLEHYESLL